MGTWFAPSVQPSVRPAAVCCGPTARKESNKCAVTLPTVGQSRYSFRDLTILYTIICIDVEL